MYFSNLMSGTFWWPKELIRLINLPKKPIRDHNFVLTEMIARMLDSKTFTETSYDELVILRPSTN